MRKVGFIMKTFSIKIEGVNNLKIKTLADLHIGDPYCDLKTIKKEIEKIKDSKDCYVLLNGDLMNNAIKTSVSDVYGEVMTPMEQLNTCISLFSPIREKILGVTAGNHERRSYNNSGIALMEVFCMQLGLMDRYDPDGMVIFVRFGKTRKGRLQRYSIYMTHGAGGGRKAGAKANRLEDMENLIDTDIYVHSHSHLGMVFKKDFFRIDNINSSVEKVEKVFVNTNAFLKYGGYGEAYEYTPYAIAVPTIELDGYSRKISVKI